MSNVFSNILHIIRLYTACIKIYSYKIFTEYAFNFLDPCFYHLCPVNQRCEPNWLTNKPSCVDNCPSHCPDFYSPVCGSDMKTYNNECELKVRSCLTGGKLKKIADQAC